MNEGYDRMRKDDGAQMFSNWLDTAMESRGYTNKDLATKIGVHESMTSRWRSARSTPSPENCERLAKALDVDYLALTVTAGLVDGGAIGVDPLPVPPRAVRERIRNQLQHVKGLTDKSIEAALQQWDADMNKETR